jgi:hypothetical protein
MIEQKLIFGVYTVADGITTVWIGGSSRSWWAVLAGIYTDITAIALRSRRGNDRTCVQSAHSSKAY